MKRLWLVLAFCLSLTGGALAQGGMGPGPGTVHSAGATFQGPANVASNLVKFGSCARAVSAAYANGTNPLCDLVDSAAPTTVICTLRVLTTGFVDLAGAYCTGSVTPAVKCAAATGGTCNISQVYDQLAGSGSPWTIATAAQQPKLAFSSINGLPGMIGTNAAGSRVVSGSVTQNSPYTMFTVFKRTSGTANQVMAVEGNSNGCGPWNAADTIACRSASSVVVTDNTHSTDNVYHAVQGVFSTGAGTSSLNIDGNTTTWNAGGNNIAGTSNIGRFPTVASLDGTVMEVGLINGASSGADITALNSNAHGANGYNF